MENLIITNDVINQIVGSGLVYGVGFGIASCLFGYGIRKLFVIMRSSWG